MINRWFLTSIILCISGWILFFLLQGIIPTILHFDYNLGFKLGLSILGITMFISLMIPVILSMEEPTMENDEIGFS